MELIIQKRGARLTCRNGMFLLQHAEGETSVPVPDVKSVCLHQSVLVSTNALFAAIEHNIDVLLLDKRGHPVGRLWNNKFGTTVTTRQNQLRFMNSAGAAGWCRDLLIRKLENQATVLLSLYQYGDNDHRLIQTSIDQLENYKEKIRDSVSAGSKVEILPVYRGWEGNCSKIYFRCISAHLPEEYRFGKRSQHPAADVFNAALNYAYGMLYSLVEGNLIKAGLDPTLGIFHEPVQNKPVLVYDVIELFRYWADYLVIQLCRQQVLLPGFFTSDGNEVSLETDGKRVLVQTFNDYLNEVIEWEGKERSRQVQIEQQAYKLAQFINQYNE